MNIPVNENAPTIARASIAIAAPLGTVWQVLADINGWPAWQKAVTAAQLDGEMQEGAGFTWKAGGLRFTSQLHTVKPMERFGWTGRTIGTSAIHNWTFSHDGTNTTVLVEESLSGFLPMLFKGAFQKKVEEGIHTNLEELKQAAEGRVDPLHQ